MSNDQGLGTEGYSVRRGGGEASDDSDVEGHGMRPKASDDSDVEGHAMRPKASDDSDVEGHGMRPKA
ncbi:MAG: hypothetical protein LH650_03660, partial [Chloroflexi bacterium]|nr:hypothetical protein [Chloroflexota bacterium]